MPIEQQISPLVESLFPSFYASEGQNFVAFVSAYFEWLEQSFQLLSMVSTEGFKVGDKLTQVQTPTVTSTGIIYAIEDNTLLVQLTSFATFRCELRCSVLADVVNEEGISSKIIKQTRINPIFGARNLFKFRDVDTTIDSFILHFKEKYLKNIQFNVATNKQLLIKNSLDLYRSKGTERAIDLFFKLIYNKNAEVYYPGDDIFRLSDGDWYVPRYIEISRSDKSINLVGKTIEGLTSGAKAFVEKYIKRKVATGYIYVFYISNVEGTFSSGELLVADEVFQDGPKVLGSLNRLTILSSGSGYSVGDIVDVVDEYGQYGKARVASVTTTTGEVEFIFISGGYGYSVEPIKYLSDKILTISNVSTTDTQYFREFDNFSQKLANLTLASITSNAISTGDQVFSYYANGDTRAQGEVLSSTMSTVVEVTIDTDANTTTLLTLSSGNTSSISIGDLVIGSTNTSVVNTDISSRVISITNTTAFEVNSAILVSNGTASVALSSTSQVGELFVYVSEGEFEANNIYTTGNVITGDIGSVLDKSISAKVIKPASSLLLSVSNAVGSFSVGETIYQSNGAANGIISESNISGGTGFISIAPYSGLWDNTNPIEVIGSNSICNLISFTTTLAIQFNREKNVEVTVDTSVNSTSLLIFSAGNTSGMQAGDQLWYSSNTAVVNTFNQAFIETIVNSTAIVMDNNVVQSNGTATITILDITDNDLISNNQVFCYTDQSNTKFVIDSISLGSGADYALVNVETSEQVFINTDMLGGTNSSNVPYMSISLDAPAYGFPKDPSANSDSYLISALDFSLLNIGSITDVITSNLGSDYTLAPVAVVVEPAIAALNLKDYILEVQETPGTIQIGDILTQNVSNSTPTILTVSNTEPFVIGETVYQGANLEFSTANGVVYIANIISGTLSLVGTQGTFSNTSNVESHISAATETVFAVNTSSISSEVARGVVSQAIIGSNTTTLYVTRTSVSSFKISGNTVSTEDNATANIISVGEQSESIPIGLNANVEANVVISIGAADSLEIIDSGFGYQNNSVVTFSGNSTQSNGTARVLSDSYGEGIGRYRSTKGFLSEDKYIFDGDYYQEYSYEVISSFSFDKYSDIFKKVMHVAGTNLFGSVALQDTGSVLLTSGEFEVDIEELEEDLLSLDGDLLTLDGEYLTLYD